MPQTNSCIISLDKSVATVSPTGLVTMLGDTGTSTTIVIASADGSISTTCSVFSTTIFLGRWPQTEYVNFSGGGSPKKETRGMFEYETHPNKGTVCKLNDKYYKVEQIKWRIITDDYYGDGTGKKLYVADKALYAGVHFYDGGVNMERTIDSLSVKSNNYKHSKIRAWLNGISYQKDNSTDTTHAAKGFLQTAFTDEQQTRILATTVTNKLASTVPYFDTDNWSVGNKGYICEDTQDKIFLLSVGEITNAPYYWSSFLPEWGDKDPRRVRDATDFAFANSNTSNENVMYYLRSPRSSNAGGVRADGSLFAARVDSNQFYIVPALCLD